MSALVTGIGVATSLIGAIPKLLPLIAIGLVATGNGKVLGEVAKNVLGSFKGILEGVGFFESEKDIEKRETENQINQMGFVSSQKDGKLLDGAALPTEAIENATQGREKNGMDRFGEGLANGDADGAFFGILSGSLPAHVYKGVKELTVGSDHAKKVAKDMVNAGFTMPDGSDATDYIVDVWRQSEADENKALGGYQPLLTFGKNIAFGKDEAYYNKVKERFDKSIAEASANGELKYNVDVANYKEVFEDLVGQVVDNNDESISSEKNKAFIKDALLKKGLEAPDGDIDKFLSVTLNQTSFKVDPSQTEHQIGGKYSNGDDKLEKEEKTKAFTEAFIENGGKLNLSSANKAVSDKTASRSSQTATTEKAESTDQLLAAGEKSTKEATQKAKDVGKEVKKKEEPLIFLN